MAYLVTVGKCNNSSAKCFLEMGTAMSDMSTQDEFRHQIGAYTEAVFMHSIALGHGKTHQEAADAIMELVLLREQSIKEQAEIEGKLWVASRMWYTGMEVGIMDRGAFIPQEHFIRQLHSINNSLEEK